MALRIHVLQHTDTSGPGSVLEWLKTKGHASTIVRLHKGDALPSVDETDWLIVMGGSMNVDDVADHPWLAEEKKLLKEAIAAKKTCFGICLGGQLLAQALGAEVKKHEHWEVGWHTVHFGAGADSRLMAFQWHQDTFGLPEGAVRVATNRITENQAFAYGDNVVGLQFHPEATEEWVRYCADGDDLPQGPHVQTKDQILEGLVFLTPLKKWLYELLTRLETITVQKTKK
jgi:GMP synthase-like glutamine amidotransferase